MVTRGTFLVSSLLLSGLALAGSSVVGNGKVVETTRPVGDFTSVTVSAGIHAIVTVGAKAPLKLKGEENVLPYVETEVQNGKLRIGWKSGTNIHSKDSVVVTAQAPQVSAIEASGGAEITLNGSGSGDALQIGASGGGRATAKGPLKGKSVQASSTGGSEVHLGGIDAGKLSLECSGGGTVEAAGKATELSLQFSGGSVVKAKGLTVERADVRGSGGGDGTITAANVTGSLSGGTSLRVPKTAKVEVKTSGGASVERD